MHNPLLSDIEPSKTQFAPGDRVLVRVYCYLTDDQRHNIQKSIKKYAGEDVNLLIFPAHWASMYVTHADGNGTYLSECMPEVQPTLGVLHLRCAKVDLPPLSKLVVRDYREMSAIQQQECRRMIERWAGADVEVVLLTGA